MSFFVAEFDWYFGIQIFDRLMIVVAMYRPTFAHRLYNKRVCTYFG